MLGISRNAEGETEIRQSELEFHDDGLCYGFDYICKTAYNKSLVFSDLSPPEHL